MRINGAEIDRARDEAARIGAMQRRLTKLTARDLRAGYGVEDIAVRHGFDLEDVRAKIADWRRRGFLRPILEGRHGEGGKRDMGSAR